jgi:hypothetical protein
MKGIRIPRAGIVFGLQVSDGCRGSLEGEIGVNWPPWNLPGKHPRARATASFFLYSVTLSKHHCFIGSSPSTGHLLACKTCQSCSWELWALHLRCRWSQWGTRTRQSSPMSCHPWTPQLVPIPILRVLPGWVGTAVFPWHARCSDCRTGAWRAELRARRVREPGPRTLFER